MAGPINLGHVGTIAVGTADVVLTEKSASAQKGTGMKWYHWTLLAIGLLVGSNIALGYAYHYGIVDQPPPNFFGRDGGNQQRFNGLMSNGPILAPIDRQPGPPRSEQWEAVDNAAIQVPVGWTLSDQGPSCPGGTHRVATGKIKTLPNGDVMVEEICQ